MLKDEYFDFMEEIISKEIEKDHFDKTRDFLELISMRSVVHTCKTLFEYDMSDEFAYSYIRDMFKL